MLPAGATAKPGLSDQEMQERATFRFQGSNGYQFEVAAHTGRKGSFFNFVSVTAARGMAKVSYLVPGVLGSDDSLNVRLPHVGRIAVEFERTGTTHERLPGDCKGAPSIVEHGFFRGTIDLRGERGYTTVERRSARGRLIRSSQKPCDKLASDRRHPAPGGDRRVRGAGSVLAAGPRGESSSLILLAALLEVDSKHAIAIFTVTKMRHREGMVIQTTIGAKGKPDTLVAPDPGEPKVAELAPPAPFEGAATFELTSPKSSTWKGDLAAELPGLGRIRLAGPSFESTLCRQSRCTNTAHGNVRLVAELFAEFFS